MEANSIDINHAVLDEYANFCSYIGFRTDVSSLISLSNIVVLPSYYKEGVPRVLIEGASLAKPLIATDVDGCRDIVIDNFNGLLIPKNNSEALAKCILELIKKSDLRIKMGQNGKKLVKEKFSLEIVCSKWRDLYDV